MARLSRIVIPDVPHHITQRGNRRLPIFLGNRIFALMGYGLVEGRMSGGLIGERTRVDFAPSAGR